MEVHQATPDHVKLMAGIGHVCLQWALLETTIAGLLWAQLKLDTETGAIVTGGLDMLPRLNMAINLAQHEKAPRPIITGLKDIRKRIQDELGDRRNQAVHGAHKPSDDGRGIDLLMLRWKGDKRMQTVTVDQMYELGVALQELAAAADILWRDYGIWRFGAGHDFENLNHQQA